MALLGLAREQGGAHRLGEIVGELMQLEVRAHPLFQPIVREYREVAHLLIRRPRSNPRQRLEENDALAQQINALGESVNEALHLFEVNRPAPVSRPAPSTRPVSTTADWQPAPRRDALTRAIDAFEEKTETGR